MPSRQKVLREGETRALQRERGGEERNGPFSPCPPLGAPWMSTDTPQPWEVPPCSRPQGT